MKKGEIIVTTTGVEITPYYDKQNRYLENLTSTFGAKRGNYSRRNPTTGFFLNYENTQPCFVTHRHDPVWLQHQFEGYEVKYTEVAKSKKLSESFGLNPDIAPREVQYQMIQEVLNHEKEHQWFIYLSQGLGKTLLSVYLISYFNVKTLIMCYNKDILSQWYKTLKSKSTIDPKKVLMITSSMLLKNILYGEFPTMEYDIFLCTPGLLVSFGKKVGFHKIPIVLDRMGIGFKIYDEAHRNIANIVKINAFTSIDKTLYLSGDFGQSDPRKEKLYFNMFHGVPILKPDDELMNTLKFTVAMVIEYDSEPTELDKTGMYTKNGFSFYNYMKYQFRKDVFFETLDNIIQSISKANHEGYKILILLNMIDHVDEMTDRMKEKYGDRYVIGRYHGSVPEDEKEETLKQSNMIVTTYQSFSTGIDVSLIKYVISCSVCTKIDDNQSSGRARPLPDGSDAFYFMMTDIGVPYVKKKLRSRIQYLQETKIKEVKKIKYW